MEAVGEPHNNAAIQHWQRMAGQHHENHYGANQQLMLHHQSNIVDIQNSPINGSVDGGFTYGSSQPDSEYYYYYL